MPNKLRLQPSVAKSLVAKTDKDQKTDLSEDRRDALIRRSRKNKMTIKPNTARSDSDSDYA